MDGAGFEYIGNELDLFLEAKNWKAYWASVVGPYVGASVLDVGAGIGATAELLCSASTARWLALEPDPSLAAKISSKIEAGQLPPCCEVRVGFVSDIVDESFDTILYADVLEHIQDDRSELERAAALLKPGGYLVVLSPAMDWLFSPFDEAIGHFRRYTRKSLRSVAPANLKPIDVSYLDSIGVLASAANHFFLRASQPSRNQIQIWDRFMVPWSRAIDPILGFRLGKSVIGIWQRRS